MTPRPSRERIEEIRDLAKRPERALYRELFAEIDALTSERDEALRRVQELEKELDEALAEGKE